MTQMNLSIKGKQNHRYREQTCGCSPKGKGVGGGMEREVGFNRWKLLYIEWINSTVLPSITENYMQYLMINHNRKEYKKGYICIYIFIKLNHFAIQQ